MRKVYVLTETYKDGDRENIGVYGSMRAMARGFAEHIIEQEKARLITAVGAEDRAKDEETFDTDMAHKIADLLTALFDLDPSMEECRDGNTVYGWMEEEVQWVGIEAEGEEEDEEDEE